MDSKYYNLKISARGMETLLIQARSLINSKKITNNLPDDFNSEIDNMNEKINKVDRLVEISECLDGGVY